ncbi:MAG: PIN domain-containing protein [Gemmatimonadaceae bacterium]|nr:PIN domain-containing protein [Gemmatimonadaceae bacterium]
MVNLDSHILIFALAGDVTAKERRVLAGNTWSISAIVLWELAKLVQIGRIRMDLEDGEIVRTLSALHIWPIDLAVCVQSTHLDFKAGPADELIAATSLVHGVPLLTRDRRIRKSRIVPMA